MVTCSQNNIFKPKTLFISIISLLYSLIEPTCVSHALNIPEWRQAMSKEFDALIQLSNLFFLILNRISLVTSGFFELRKIMMAQFVNAMPVLWPKVFHQRPSLDYTNIFSSIIKPTVVCLVLCLALSHNWSIRQLDVNNTFLHGFISEDVYMTQPPGFVHPNFLDHACKL